MSGAAQGNQPQGEMLAYRPKGELRMPFKRQRRFSWRTDMGRGILLWLLGVPIPIIILLALIWH
jgi:hypothetical protein